MQEAGEVGKSVLFPVGEGTSWFHCVLHPAFAAFPGYMLNLLFFNKVLYEIQTDLDETYVPQLSEVLSTATSLSFQWEL